VESDWAEGIRLAFARLKERGYRRIGVVLRPYSLREKREIILSRALLEVDAMTREFGPQPRIELLGTEETQHESQFWSWLVEERPDAIVASNSNVYRWVEEKCAARARPAVLCLYNQGAGSDERVSCLHHSHLAEGKEAVDLLDHLLRYRLTGLPRYPTQIMVAPSWQEGKSTPRRPRRSEAP
jgi:DNA-binding LacI/PurR family transcriptional regulator